MNQKQKNLIFGLIILGFVLIWYCFFLFHKIDLTTADLGRHLKNGELILKDFSFDSEILKTNFYSYTESEYSTLNHHWLSGVIFFIVFKAFGFNGLHLFFIALSLFTFWLFFKIAEDEIGVEIASVLSLFIIPLIAERVEVRPEIFSYLFSGLFLISLLAWRKDKLKFRFLLFLPLLQLFWVNLHILSILGPILIGTFLTESLILTSKRKDFSKLAIIFVLVILASLINPFGLKGSLAIFEVLREYGYRLVENQSVWFLEKLGFVINPNFLLFKMVFLALVTSIVVAIKVSKKDFPLVNLFLAAGFSLAGFLALRNFTIFGLFSLPLIAGSIKIITDKKPLPEQISFDFFSFPFKVLLVIIGFVFLTWGLITHSQEISLSKMGMGLLDNNTQAIGFFKQNQLSGPIFNNYDVGGYLIFYLFPQERVFVDNRPEAYSVDFFQKEYIPLQEQADKWQTGEEQYGFKTIFFSHRDATPWGQSFLIDRVKDSEWAPVYFDDFIVIFLKRTSENLEVIEKYEIPLNYFNIQ
ncbi:hypothetical protein L6250_02110 [Candidatus Parcubacteria bacterium]|nr:hypothetical protein [Patescibacteria group bacterium]MBU4467011.1 hypothetical protein [Patescibacteria group bacterium]MCG2688410.1 hypothetical protein [Candidatus Parcubacteria bacterium]